MGELKELLAELWDDRRRLLLVVVALAWGTLGLTVLLGFGNGFDIAMHSVLRESGDRMLRLSGGVSSLPHGGLPAGRYCTPTPEDADALRSLDGVARVSVEHMINTTLRAGARSLNGRVHGVDDDYANVRGMRVRRGGRFLSPTDAGERRRVAVLGVFAARELFGDADPIGRTVRIGATPHLVVGVLEQRITVMNHSGDDDFKTFVPAATMRALHGVRNPAASWSRPKTRNEAARSSSTCAAPSRSALAQRLRFDPADRAAVTIRDHPADTRQIGAIVVGVRLFLAIVGVLGLLVAAVGVANVVHALVEERVREIGLRLALGARPRQIFARRLLETLLLVAIGGGAGLLGAMLVLLGLDALPLDARARTYLGSPVPSVLVAATVALLLGLAAGIAGWQPARRAAAVEPVEALRHE